MTAFLDNAATIQDDDTVGMANSREAVGNDNGGAVLQHEVKTFLNLRLGERINAGRCFIENNDGWVLQQDSCQGDKLSLPHGKRFSFLAHHGIQTIGECVDPVAPADVL